MFILCVCTHVNMFRALKNKIYSGLDCDMKKDKSSTFIANTNYRILLWYDYVVHLVYML